MKTNEQIVCRLSKADFSLADIDKKASELGMSRTELVLEAVGMMLNFDTEFYKKIQRYGRALNVPVWRVLQNMITKRLAKEAAENKVYGIRSRVFDEFYSSLNDKDERVMPGFIELFDHIKNDEVKRLEREKRDNKLLYILRKQSLSLPLSEEEKFFLDEQQIEGD